jgi:hypothetical protein
MGSILAVTRNSASRSGVNPRIEKRTNSVAQYSLGLPWSY